MQLSDAKYCLPAHHVHKNAPPGEGKKRKSVRGLICSKIIPYLCMPINYRINS